MKIFVSTTGNYLPIHSTSIKWQSLSNETKILFRAIGHPFLRLMTMWLGKFYFIFECMQEIQQNASNRPLLYVSNRPPDLWKPCCKNVQICVFQGRLSLFLPRDSAVHVSNCYISTPLPPESWDGPGWNLATNCPRIQLNKMPKNIKLEVIT